METKCSQNFLDGPEREKTRGGFNRRHSAIQSEVGVEGGGVLPAAAHGAERDGVSHHGHQGLGPGDGRVEQLVVGQEAVVQVLGGVLHQLLLALDGRLLVLAGVPRAHRAEEQHPELFACGSVCKAAGRYWKRRAREKMQGKFPSLKMIFVGGVGVKSREEPTSSLQK